MNWLSKIFNYVPKEKSSGISLDRKTPYWVIKGFRDFPIFIRSLSNLFPKDSVLYLEGSSIADDVQEFLEMRKSKETTKVAIGTIWPRPKAFHMKLTDENISGLATLAENHAGPEICDHLHVYKNNNVLLEAHDVGDQCISLNGQLSEDQIKALCTKLGSEYKKGDGGCFCSPGRY